MRIESKQLCQQQGVEIAKAMGATNIRPTPTLRDQRPHLTGDTPHTWRPIHGTSPETSVLNRYMQHWNLPNLWVWRIRRFRSPMSTKR